MKYRRCAGLSLAALLLSGGIGVAQAAQDLLESYRLAVQSDPQLAAARWQREAQRERIDQARSLFLPDIGLEGEAARNDIDYEAPATPERPAGSVSDRYTSTSYGVALTQPLFRAESFVVYRQAKTLVNQADLQLGLAHQNLILRLVETYFAVLQAQNALETFDAELQAIEQQLRRAQRAFEVGSGTITDVNDAQARYDITVAQRVAAVNQLQVARERLRRLTGARADELADVANTFQPQTPAPEAPDAWAELAEEKNLQVLLAASNLAFSREEVSRQRAQRYPRVDLVARYGKNSPAPSSFDEDSEATQGSVGVNLTVPLYTGGAISSQVSEAQYNRSAALSQLEDAQREAAITAESAFLELQANVEQLRALQQALKSIRLNEESTRRGMELGLRTTLDVLDIQRERYAAERDLAAARYNYLLNYIRLQAAVGRATDEEIIAQVNQYLVEEVPTSAE